MGPSTGGWHSRVTFFAKSGSVDFMLRIEPSRGPGVLLLLLSLGAAGCHLIFPYEGTTDSGKGAPDVMADLGSRLDLAGEHDRGPTVQDRGPQKDKGPSVDKTTPKLDKGPPVDKAGPKLDKGPPKADMIPWPADLVGPKLDKGPPPPDKTLPKPEQFKPMDGTVVAEDIGVTTPDAGKPGPDATSVCNEALDINTTTGVCSKQCLTSVDDTDCDGLMDGKADPDKSTCNLLWFSDDFNQSFASLATNWTTTLSGSGAWSWTCGTVHMPESASMTFKKTSLLLDNRYLAFVRFKPLSPGKNVDWAFMVATNYSITNSFHCGLKRDQSGAGAELTLGYSGSSSATCTTSSLSTAQANITFGTLYTLVLYTAPSSATCKLLGGSGYTVAQLTVNAKAACMASSPGTVKITTKELATTVDTVRIFNVP